MSDPKSWEGYAILELFGHQRLVGKLSEETIGGASFVRIDVPAAGDRGPETHFYGGSAVYGIHPTTEAMVRAWPRRTARSRSASTS